MTRVRVRRRGVAVAVSRVRGSSSPDERHLPRLPSISIARDSRGERLHGRERPSRGVLQDRRHHLPRHASVQIFAEYFHRQAFLRGPPRDGVRHPG